jgi:hypothetical protein
VSNGSTDPTSKGLRDAIAFVRLGYGDQFGLDFRSNNFRTDEMTTEDTQAVLRIVDEYNDFSGKKVADAIGQFRGRISSYEFGREGSPVLYIRLPYWTHQQEGAAPGSSGRRIDDAENEALISLLRDVFVTKLGADEFEVDQIQGRKFRVWWD